MRHVDLRPATLADWAFLWRCRNDPETRRWSFDSSEVSLVDHMRWLDAALKDPAVGIYVARASCVGERHELGPVGVGRFAWLDPVVTDKVFVSVTVDPRRRGQGFGSALVRTLATTVEGVIARADRRAHLVAEVKLDNVASLCAFGSAGFRPVKYLADRVVLCRP